MSSTDKCPHTGWMHAESLPGPILRTMPVLMFAPSPLAGAFWSRVAVDHDDNTDCRYFCAETSPRWFSASVPGTA